MNPKLIIALSVVVRTSAFAQGQMGGASLQGPKPTKADVQKVVAQSQVKLHDANEQTPADEQSDKKAAAAS